MFKKIFYSIVLLGFNKLSITMKLQYITKLVLTFTPLVYILDSFNLWFAKNEQFFGFMLYTLIINMVVGGWYHLNFKTFSWRSFFIKNIQMWVVIILAFPTLEFMRQIAGENIAGELFKVTIQIATLLYPASKILKNVYILSNKQYPPSFIMEKIYKFEKDGDVVELFNKNKEDE